MELVNKGITALKGEHQSEGTSLGTPCCHTLCSNYLSYAACE